MATKHVEIKAVADVDRFIDSKKLKLSDVQIVHRSGKFGSAYMVFYQEGADGRE